MDHHRKQQFHQLFVLSEPCGSYLKKCEEKKVVCTLSVDNRTLLALNSCYKDDEFRYLHIVNHAVEYIHINEDCERLEERFAMVTRKVFSEWRQQRNKGQKQREIYLDSQRKIHIFQNELKSFHESEGELIQLKIDLVRLEAKSSHY